MKFFIDTANLDQIREANELGVLDGKSRQSDVGIAQTDREKVSETFTIILHTFYQTSLMYFT